MTADALLHKDGTRMVCIQKLKEPDAGIPAALGLSFKRILQELNLKGDEKVLLKPNLVNSSPACSGVTTDLGILSSLVKLLQREGIEEIWIGESSIEDTGQVLRALGVAKLENLGARVINFDEEGWVTVESPLRLALQRFRIARSAMDCDLIISAAKMKTHCDTGVTLSMKNLLGTISPRTGRLLTAPIFTRLSWMSTLISTKTNGLFQL